jgi:hypothetical protein
MGRIAVVGYKPKPGQASALKELMRTHLPVLRSQGLVTERASIVMEAAGGTIVEVFEWRSPQAIEAAHTNPAVAEMWQAYDAVCEYVPIGSLAEASELFSEFAPLNVE